ncbi:MAG: hypothetical protein KBC73_25155 [Burkholderiaceae bacterium]|nr:hypothetical protein [Burkholderiaceae bacterium]
MQNRLLEDLDQKIRTTSSRVDWSRLMCRKSVLLARQGQLDAAQRQIDQVRKVWGEELHHEVASWVMMAEGVLHFFRLDTHMAWERLRRAHALAVALRTESSRASCAAWMALLAFNGSRYDEMCDRLREVLTEAAAEDHHARGRACLIIADAYHVAGRWDLAKPWYDKARYHAADEGDQSTLSAMLFNVAACRTSNVRLADAFGEPNPELNVEIAVSEVGTSRVYDLAVGAKSLQQLTPLMHAQIQVVEHQYPSALAILNSIDRAGLQPKEIPQLLCEQAWCNACLGSNDLATEQANQSEACMDSMFDDDDYAYVGARLSQVWASLGRPDRSSDLRCKASLRLDAHRTLQAKLAASLDSLLSEVGDPK